MNNRLNKLLGSEILSLVLLAASCEEIIPYPDTGATEMMYIEGVARYDGSMFTVRRIFPISEKTFVTRKGETLFYASMTLTVNGEEVPTACVNDSLSCVFTTDYKFQAEDRILVMVSTEGLPDAYCETTVPEVSEVKSMSYILKEDNTLDFNASIQTSPRMMDGYVYFHEMETEVKEYVDGELKTETTGRQIQRIHENIQGIKNIFYGDLPVTGYEYADGNGMHHLKSNVGLSSSFEIPDSEGHVTRIETRVSRIRFCAWRLSTAMYLSLKTDRGKWDYDESSQMSFVTPFEYSNVKGGKGTIGAMSVYKSAWREL